jgi:hypothetical protein
MTDLLLRDIDAVLAARIRKVAETNGWTMHETILHLIERGLFASEGGALRFDGAESDVMQSAIAALETVPNDPGFSLIGRVALPEQTSSEVSLEESDFMRELDEAAERIAAAPKL